MTISIIQKPKKLVDYYVYFEQWAGEIVNISSQPIENINHPYIITNDPITTKIMHGKADLFDYVVEGQQVISREDRQILRMGKSNIYEIEEGQNKEWDISLRMFKNGMLQIEYNVQRIRHFDTDIDIIFFITKKDDINFFVAHISTKLVDLIQEPLYFDLKHIRQYIDIFDVSFITYRQFEYYNLEFIDEPHDKNYSRNRV